MLRACLCWAGRPKSSIGATKIDCRGGQKLDRGPGKIDPKANQNGSLDCQDRFPLHFEAALEVALVFEVASLTGGVQWGRPTKPQACYFQIGNS